MSRFMVNNTASLCDFKANVSIKKKPRGLNVVILECSSKSASSTIGWWSLFLQHIITVHRHHSMEKLWAPRECGVCCESRMLFRELSQEGMKPSVRVRGLDLLDEWTVFQRSDVFSNLGIDGEIVATWLQSQLWGTHFEYGSHTAVRRGSAWLKNGRILDTVCY